jgi:predicted amidohydrolase YtcJ
MWHRAFGVLLLSSYTAIGLAAPPADIVFMNGAVYTVDEARSWASAVVVTGDRITYVGDDATARTFIGGSTHVVDLNHRMLLPGFQDSHVHPLEVPNPANSIDLHDLTVRAEIFDRIRRYAHANPEKAWIVGDGWDEAAFLPDGHPTRQMLDALVPDRPAYLTNNSGHQAWVNSRALAAAHISAATSDPQNGHIERDSQGYPSGDLQENAADLVARMIPPPTPEQLVENLSAALRQMGQLGFTALEDAMVKPEYAHAYETLDRAGRLPMRVNLCQLYSEAQSDEDQIRRFIALRNAIASPSLHATCVKIFLDGAYGGHTVALLEPYSDDPKFGKGRVFVDQDRLNHLVSRLDAADFQVHFHAQGDAAVRAALDSFAEARQMNGFHDNRHTIAHLALVNDSDVPRFRILGVVANMTPRWSLGDPWESVYAPRLFGVERSSHLLRTRTLLDAGAILVWGSDWPVTSVSPFEGIETAITHRYPGGKDPAGKEDSTWNPQERVSLEQALAAYTAAGAYMMHDDLMRGSLVAGKAADLVVLSNNLFDMAPLELHNVKVDMTVLGGKVIFARHSDAP